MPHVGPETRIYVGERAQRAVDRGIAELAGGQHGVVTINQLRNLGMDEQSAWDRLSTGKLHRVHQGVYAVGHPLLTRKGRLMAAVLACGEGAFLSHRSAGDHRGLVSNNSARIDVSSPTRAGRRHRNVLVHRVWCEDQVDVVDGIPCASVPLTLLQLAAVGDVRRVERALERAEVLELFDLHAILELLERAGRRRGVARLRRALALSRPELPISRSELEGCFLELCRRHGLPLPSFRAWVPVDGDAMEVDFLWRDWGLVVETDSRRFHFTTRAFETDRRRDQLLVAAGYRVVRFTWRQITSAEDEVVATLRSLLSAPAAPAPPRPPAPA